MQINVAEFDGSDKPPITRKFAVTGLDEWKEAINAKGVPPINSTFRKLNKLFRCVERRIVAVRNGACVVHCLYEPLT
jgi:hypothetical protein